MFGPGIYFIMNIGFKNVSLKRSTTSFEATHFLRSCKLDKYCTQIHLFMSSFASITSSAIPLIIFQTVHVILSLHTVFNNTTNFPPSVAAKHVFNVFYLNCSELCWCSGVANGNYGN